MKFDSVLYLRILWIRNVLELLLRIERSYLQLIHYAGLEYSVFPPDDKWTQYFEHFLQLFVWDISEYDKKIFLFHWAFGTDRIKI